MNIGVPKEIKDKENRVALTPAGAAALVAAGHAVAVQAGAGLGSGFDDADYQAAGAILADAASCWNQDLVVKVKEPLESEYPYLKDQIVFTYFHLAGVTPSLTEVLLERGTTAVAYETLRDGQGRLPLLAPMSAVAGGMAALIGGYYLAKFNGGKGVLLGEVLGEQHGKVLIIGDGVVGRHAARAALGLGARVLLAGRHAERLPQLRAETGDGLEFIPSTPAGIAAELADTDLLIGAVLLPGAKAPRVVTEAMVKTLQPGSVIVDVSIDQGGCIETSRPTSHSDPVYLRHEVIHYCVTNMPGAYPRTSTLALTNATLPYVLQLAENGVTAWAADPGLAAAVNTRQGQLCNRAVAEALGRPWRALA